MANKKGKPKTTVRPSPGSGERHPKTTVRPIPEQDENKPLFSFRYADRTHYGSWSWPDGDAAREILDFVCDMSELNWTEISAQQTGGRQRHRKHHHQNFESVSPEAQARVTELRYDEIFEEYYRFRLSGQKRLWGFRRQGVFYPLWWDAQHAVYPTEQD